MITRGEEEEEEVGGLDTPKNDDIIYEQPLSVKRYCLFLFIILVVVYWN